MTSCEKNLLWFVSTTEDTKFLKEFSREYDGSISVVHLNAITRLSLLGFKGKHYFPYLKYQTRQIHPEVSKTFNVLAGRLSIEDAQAAYRSTYGLLNHIRECIEDVVYIIPSGRHVHHVAATEFARNEGISCIYINYSNFPGYTFFDPKGTDCLSSIYENPSILDEKFPGDIDVQKVFSEFSDLKKEQVGIPQAQSVEWKKNLKNVAFYIDQALQGLLGYAGDRKVINKSNVSSAKNDFSYDAAALEERYLFFPMQVSTDQQVLVNYNGGSIVAALDEACELAKSRNLLLYVREHPAEGDKDYVRKILNEKRSCTPNLKVTSHTVYDLIRCSEEVVTVNSTIGLECRINNKDVTFLGKSFYDKATDNQLAKYLKYYLVKVDYHQPRLNRSLVDKILGFSNGY